MTPAEMKTIRESLGLTPKWIAEHAGVKERAARQWEAGRSPIPKNVEEMLVDIDRLLDRSVAKVLTRIEEVEKEQGRTPNEVMLIRYRTDDDLWRFYPDLKPLPVATYAVVLSRLRRRLWSKGIPSVIEYMEPEEYLAWLKGRTDTEADRSEWALRKREKEGGL